MTAFAARSLFFLLLLAGMAGTMGTANAHGRGHDVVLSEPAERIVVASPVLLEQKSVESVVLKGVGADHPPSHGDDDCCCACGGGACHAAALPPAASLWVVSAGDIGDHRNRAAPPRRLPASPDHPPKSFR